MDCCVKAGVINGISNFMPSAWTKETLTEGSLNSVAKELIAVGTERFGWDGFLSWKDIECIRRNKITRYTYITEKWAISVKYKSQKRPTLSSKSPDTFETNETN